MQPASVFLIIQLSNSRAFAREKFGPEEIYPLFFSGQLHFWEKKIIIKIYLPNSLQ